MAYPYDANEVLSLSKGRYNELAQRFFGGALERAIAHPGRAVPNPWAPGTKDAMRVDRRFNENGKVWFNTNTFGVSGPLIPFRSLMILAGVASDMGDYFSKVGAYLGLKRRDGRSLGEEDEAAAAARRAEMARRQAEWEERERKAEARRSHEARLQNQQIWAYTVPLFAGGRPNPEAAGIWSYFQSRGLGMLANAPASALKYLRAARSLPYKDAETGKEQAFEALVARVEDEFGTGVCLHRTYLLDGLKAPVASPKKLTPTDRTVRGGARYIPFGDVASAADGIVGVAEGIETALSCFCAMGFRMPVCSCVCANELMKFVPPRGVRHVVIFADRDASGTGEKAARELKRRLAGMGVKGWLLLPRTRIPEGSKGVDWNDEWRAAPQHFPNCSRMMEYITGKPLKAL